jgi:predicted nucleic acid-binding protein
LAKKIVISNSTALINFASIDRLDILHALFKELTVPESVWDETVVKASRYVSAKRIREAHWIKVKKVHDSNLVNLLTGKLDAGEAEAVALALEMRADVVLLDESPAREVAKKLGINFTGTVGCLIMAKRSGIIESIKPVLNRIMKDAKFWIAQDLYRTILIDQQEKP